MPNRNIMPEVLEKKTCLSCSRPIRGRADKKFCDDQCRNSYNNQLKAGTDNYMRSVSNILRKNRRILRDLLPDTKEMVRASKARLIQVGFHFRYTTHSYTNKKGQTYFFCFDYGYLLLDNEWYLVVRYKKSLT